MLPHPDPAPSSEQPRAAPSLFHFNLKLFLSSLLLLGSSRAALCTPGPCGLPGNFIKNHLNSSLTSTHTCRLTLPCPTEDGTLSLPQIHGITAGLPWKN